VKLGDKLTNEVRVVNEISIKDLDKLINTMQNVVDRLDDHRNELREIKDKLGSILTELNTVRTFDRPKLMQQLANLEVAINKLATY